MQPTLMEPGQRFGGRLTVESMPLSPVQVDSSLVLEYEVLIARQALVAPYPVLANSSSP